MTAVPARVRVRWRLRTAVGQQDRRQCILASYSSSSSSLCRRRMDGEWREEIILVSDDRVLRLRMALPGQ
jgi:hypothetical protein